MKKIIALLLSVILLFETFGTHVKAQDLVIASEVDGIEDDVNENESDEGSEEDVINTPVIDKNNYKIVILEEEFIYKGSEHCPEIDVISLETEEELSEEAYDVYYFDNINVGTAKVVVVEVDKEVDLEDENLLVEEFTIQPKNISSLQFEVDETSCYYDGTEKMPAVTVADGETVLVEGTDYELAYANNVNVGIGNVTVNAKGNYTGTVTLNFNIRLFKSTAVMKLTATPYYSKTVLEWNKVADADGYIIQRRTADGSFKTFYTTTKGTTVKLNDNSRKLGVVYFYRIAPYKRVNGEKLVGEYSKEVKQRAQVERVTNVKGTSNTYNSIKLTWNVVPGAQRYAIYRSTEKNGTFTRIGTVIGEKNVSFIDKGLVTAKTYYYKVSAYRFVDGIAHYGTKSVVVAANSKPAKVNFTSATPNYTNLTLKWKKSLGARGYEIYRSEKKSSGYRLIKKISGQNILSYKDTGLTKHKVYYYKIRPYKVMDGVTVYGNYSDVYSKPQSGWKYKNGYKLYYNAKGKLVKDLRNMGLIDKESGYVIKVNKRRNTITVYAKDPEKGTYIIPVVSFICSCGVPTPLGTHRIYKKYRWKALIGPSWGQWSCRYNGGKLFHSVYYLRPNDPYSLGVSAYNDLGTLASHGCIRLTAIDAKWIYDNCKIDTKVIIYNSSTSGPYGKPSAPKLASWHTWDPTDPYVKSRCKKYGCH